MKLSIDEVKFKEDLGYLNNGLSHFCQSDFSQSVFEKFKEKPVVIGVSDEDLDLLEYSDGTVATSYAATGVNVERSTYRLNKTGDSLIFYRNLLERHNDYNYMYESSNYGWDTISLAMAAKEIEEFAKRAPYYRGDLQDVSFNKLIEAHIAHNAVQMGLEPDHQTNFDKLLDVSRFREIVGTNAQISFKARPFNCTKWEFWSSYLFLALYLSILLFILSSVKLADFGWGLLAGALTAISYAIINGIILSQNGMPDGFEEIFNLILLSVFVLVYLWIMFGTKYKNGVKKAFGIAFQFFVPHVLFAYFGLFDAIHDCPYNRANYQVDPCLDSEYFNTDDYYAVAVWSCVTLAIAGIWFFNRYYKRRYVYPDGSK